MPVPIARLLESIRRAGWKLAALPGERWVHTVAPDGSHTITLTLRPDEVEWTPPVRLARPSFGASTPEGGDVRK